ncbi:hypothetical protein [Arthrobacter pigmenti]
MAGTQDRKTDDKMLVNYLRVHIMAADSGAQLFEQARKLWAGTPYARRVEALSADVEADRQELRSTADRFGALLPPGRQGLAILGRAFSRLNPLNPTGTRTGLPGQLELESLHAAVAGKECLWATLEKLSEQDNRFDRGQQRRLLERARDQQSRIIELIRETAAIRFRRDMSL